MWKKSNNSSMSSSPNYEGFYMGDSSGILNMYQTGGQASRGAALAKRAEQAMKDTARLEQIQKEEAKRQANVRTAQSIAKPFANVLFGPFAEFVTDSVIGMGMSGGDKKYDYTGTIYGQQLFEDVNEARKDFNESILENAAVSALDSAAKSLLTPGGGGVFEKLGGKLSTAQSRKALKDAMPLAFKQAPSSLMSMVKGTPTTGLPVAPSVDLDAFSIPFNPSASAKIFDPSSIFSSSSVGLDDVSIPFNPSASANQFSFTQPTPTQPFFQDGGLIKYTYGGGVGSVDDILKDANILATPEQLALFQEADTGSLNKLAQGLQQSAQAGTIQSAEQAAKSGFTSPIGAIQQAQKEQRQDIRDKFQYEQDAFDYDTTSQVMTDYSQFLTEGVEFDDYFKAERGESKSFSPGASVGDFTFPDGSEGTVTTPSGRVYSFNGTTGQWELQA